MKILFVIFVLVISASCVELVAAQQTKTPQDKSVVTAFPDDWVLHPYSEISDSVLRCASRSRREWKVEQAENAVKISLDRRENHQAVLPRAIRLSDVKVGIKGSRSVQPIADGWLVGRDAGEFGGGLWWFNSDGKSSKRLAADNIVGFAKTSTAVLAFAGLAHLGFDTGKVLKIVGDTAADRKIETLADLGSAPRAFVAEAPDSILVLTANSLIRVKTSGATQKLFSTRYAYLYPNSMIVSASGIIYVGMRHFVVRLTPTSDGYGEEWFVPSDCTQFEERDLDCICAAKAKR